MSPIRNSLICISLMIICAIPAAAQIDDGDDLKTFKRGEFEIKYRDEVPVAAVELVADRVEAALKIVRTYLAQATTYQGAPYKTPLVIIIDPTRFGPYQSRSTVRLPEQRVLNIHHGKTETRIDLGVIHEVTHVLAASFNRRNRDRFYDDGLAVYLQHRFGPSPGYPDFGKDLYLAVAKFAKQNGGLIPLNVAEETRNKSETQLMRKLAYLEEGAFTQFLIERFGLDAYFRIYHGTPLDKVTEKSLAELEKEWVELIHATPIWSEEK